jgi:hypothetical protein
MKQFIRLTAALLLTATAWAQAPNRMSYQAVIRNSSNTLVTNQAVGMRISILQGSPTGTIVYSEIYNPNPLTNANGLVSIEIGAGIPVTGTFASINWANGPYFIQTETDPTGGTTYTITGTSQLLSVPYALYAETAGNNTPGPQGDPGPAGPQGPQGPAGPQGATGNGIVNTIDNGNGTFTFEYADGTSVTLPSGGNTYTAGSGISISGNLISNTLPDQVVTINGSGATSVTGTYPNFTVSSANQTLSLSGSTLSISNGNSVTLPSGGGGGTLDQAYNFGGSGAGREINVNNGAVQLNVSGANAIGLRSDLGNTGSAFLASSNTASNTFSAIQSSTNSSSTNASAVIGNSSGAAWGVSGQVMNTASAEAAVYGSNLRTNGGHGVLGIGFNGIVGQTNYSQGNASYAENFDAIAPLGNGVGAAGRGYYGVVGEDRYAGSVGGAYGVLSNGNLGATGIKTFIIDHPLDPENKVLRHFSIESNEVLNIYRGNAEFDANGEAIVTLPDYFSEINRNPTYQLTPVGGQGNLYIRQKIENGQFVIAGGHLGMEVSWTVTAERYDAFVKQNPHQLEVEQEKREGQKGKYFMPNLYGQPAEKGIFYNNVEKVEQTEMNMMK